MSDKVKPGQVGLFKALIVAAAVTVATLSLTAVLAGCAGTVAPRIVSSSQASYDTNNAGGFAQNSGLLGFEPGGCLVITPHARARYNALVAVHGARFRPGLTYDEDIVPTATNTFLLAPVGIEHFSAMSRWDKQRRGNGNLH